MPIPPNWKLCVVVFLFSAAGTVAGMTLHEKMSAPQLYLGARGGLDSVPGKTFRVIETIPSFEWKS